MIKNLLQEYNEDKQKYKIAVKEEKNYIKKLKLITPNLLTKSRILAPFILFPSAIAHNFTISTIMVIILALTDCFDGGLARKWHVTSRYGQKLDAISDKLFAIGISLPILLTNPILITSTVILEFVIGFININSYLKGKNPKSTFLGKFKTIILYFLLSIIYLTKTLNI